MEVALTPLPKTSLFDREEESEGSLDPLGLASLADELASRLASDGVRERQGNIRFLTFCCVGWSVMAAIDPKLQPGDRDSTLEQAFEWMVLEALVDPTLGSSDGELRIPGILKAKDCVARGLHLNADRYLRTPGTFGFFGVYRTLAIYLRIVAEDREGRRWLRSNGERIMEAWRLDNGLPGFREDGRGPGRDDFDALLRDLSRTWTHGMAEVSPEAKRFIVAYLSPAKGPGRTEGEALWSILNDEGNRPRDINRRLLMESLLDPEVGAIFESGRPGAEREFHLALRNKANENLAQVLDAIARFEDFGACLMDSFDELRRLLSPETRLVELAPLAANDRVISGAAGKAPAAYAAAESALEAIGLSDRFTPTFGAFSSSLDPAHFAETLLEHHQRVQKNKPPAGKLSWFDVETGKVGVRPLYRLDSAPRDSDGYLYAYRGTTLHRFVAAIGRRIP